MKIFVGSIMHESNSFAEPYTTLADYGVRELLYGDDVLRWGAGTRTALGGCIDVAKQVGLELRPSMYAFAQPGGPLQRAACNFLLNRFVDQLNDALPVDGILVILHGAMMADGIDDVEGHLLKMIRGVVGSELPVVATLDFHANVTMEMIEQNAIFVGYDTYPHVDMWERGKEAMGILHSTVLQTARPVVAFQQIPLLASLPVLNTFRHPMADIMTEARRIEEEKGVISVTVSGGFPYSDMRDAGLSVQVVTDDALRLAEERAGELANFIWGLRQDFHCQLIPVGQAVSEALSSSSTPVVLADLGDNTGGGAPGDGTALLRQLLERGATNTVVALIHDPQTVGVAFSAGVGAEIEVNIGGKRDRLQGPPVHVRARVNLLSDGHYVHTGPLSTGTPGDMGRAAVLEARGVEVVVAELRRAPNDPALLRSVGIEPRHKQIIVLKSSVHYRAAYEPIAARIIEVDTPGLTSSDLGRLPFRKVRRPIFPLDEVGL